jgi:Cu/Ag efflux pump CusA
VTLPGVSVARAREILRTQDGILKSFPEVDHVWGKGGPGHDGPARCPDRSASLRARLKRTIAVSGRPCR